MLKPLVRSIFCLFLLGFSWLVMAQRVVVGEYVTMEIESGHPYQKPGTEQLKLVFEQEIFHPKSTYIAIHFAHMDLAPGDLVVVRSPESFQYWEYRGQGRGGLGVDPDGFFATQIKGEIAVIELYAAGNEPGYGFVIDFYARGYSNEELVELWALGLGEKLNLAEPSVEGLSICTADDSEEAKCFEVSEPDVYEEARGVIRLLINGNVHCTGWLIGCDGHVMTNEHCIGSQGELNNIDFEFMAEGAMCSTNCASALACSGTIEASGGTLVQVDAPLDFALVLPDTSVANQTDLPATYGYLELRASGAVLGEQIYIPQHPAGWGKRVAFQSSYPDDVGGVATVTSLTENACSGGPQDVGYWADTRGGSSGSPVLGYADHKVVALHHCRGSAFCTTGNSNSDDPNRGVPIQAIIATLGANLPNCTTCPPVSEPTSLMGQTNGNNRVDLNWSAPLKGATTYNLYRADGGCAGAAFEIIATNLNITNYSDTDVSGGSTYAYAVTAFDSGLGCESINSNCVEVMSTGLCTLTPEFAGVASVTNVASTTCEIQVNWVAGTVRCGSTLVYNIFRSTSAGFMPAPGNLLVSGVTGTSYQDVDVENGTTYFYIVRAEDDSGNGTGVHANGNQDNNTLELSATPTGPDQVLFEDDLENGPANWVAIPGPQDPGGTSPWQITSAQSNSPMNAWFVENESRIKDQTMVSATDTLLPTNPAKLSFWHRFNTETNWDGGVLEYSIDGGTQWQDILQGDGNTIPANANRFLTGEYVSNLNSGSNPLSARPAWHGNNGQFERVSVDLADMAEQSIRFRWRFGCDSSASVDGWYVDDIRLDVGQECSLECVLLEQVQLWPTVTILDLLACIQSAP